MPLHGGRHENNPAEHRPAWPPDVVIVASVEAPRISDLPTAVVAAVWVLAARYVIARRGFPAAVERYRLRPATSGGTDDALDAQVYRAARVAARVVRAPVVGATCLPAAIAVARVVASRGVRADLVLGVTTAEGFTAHAWVEAGGRRIDPSGYPAGAFAPTGRFTLEPT